MPVKLYALTTCFNQLLDIELESVLYAAKAAKKANDEESVLMAQAYVMGLQRAAQIFNTVLKDVKEE